MSTTPSSRTELDSRTALELDALEAGCATGVPGDETGQRERAGLGAGHAALASPRGARSGGSATAWARKRQTMQSEMDSKEQRSALRAAVYRGDGPAVVHLLSGVGVCDDSLQLAGDV